jgi:hypothetical protein
MNVYNNCLMYPDPHCARRIYILHYIEGNVVPDFSSLNFDCHSRESDYDQTNNFSDHTKNLILFLISNFLMNTGFIAFDWKMSNNDFATFGVVRADRGMDVVAISDIITSPNGTISNKGLMMR